ncbi:MAG: hypothetical protein QOD70_937 [Frankiales bacterium]|nr:hypothetical protein [Frankiales bacterium]
MNEDQLRALLPGAAQPGWDDEVRASSALYAGQSFARARQRRHLLVGAMGVATLGAATIVVLVPHAATPATDVVLGCAAGIGTSGAGLVTGGLDGVTLAVSNPTRQVLTVTGGHSSVLALPGTSQVTLPLSSGTSTIRCGDGSPVRLTVQHLRRPADCASVGTAQAATVQSGEISALTREQLGTLPEGAVVDASSGSSPLRRVQVRSAGEVVAEALWHEMPGAGDWQLESLSRCS